MDRSLALTWITLIGSIGYPLALAVPAAVWWWSRSMQPAQRRAAARWFGGLVGFAIALFCSVLIFKLNYDSTPRL